MILNNWKNYLTANNEENNTHVKNLVKQLEKMIENSAGDGVWQILNLNGKTLFPIKSETFYKSSGITKSAEQIYIMSLAYACNKSSYYKNKDLLYDINSALEIFSNIQYNQLKQKTGNWWDYEIGAPLLIVNILVLLGDEISEFVKQNLIDTIKYFITFETGNTGANLLDKSFAILICAELENEDIVIEKMVENLRTVYEYVEEGDGFYRDNGFIQHYNIPYIGAYGEVLISRTRDIIVAINNTKYQEFIDSNRMQEVILESYLPLVFSGCISNHTLGRSISRVTTDCYSQGQKILMSILEISNTLELNEAVYRELYNNFTCESSVDIDKLTISNYYSFSKFLKKCSHYDVKVDKLSKYIDSNNILISRTNNLITIGTCSKKISCFETGNGENLIGWYQSAGTYYIYGRENHNYCNNYYTKVNMLNLPGTTTDGKVGKLVEWNNYSNDSDIVMGCSLNNVVVSSFLINYKNITGSDMKAKKSYVVVNDILICVGSDISSVDAYTIIENRQLLKNDKVIVDKEEKIKSVTYESDYSKIIYYNINQENWNVKVSNNCANTNEININSEPQNVEGEFLSISKKHHDEKNYQYVIDTFAFDGKRVNYIDSIKIKQLTGCHYIKLTDYIIIISFKKQEVLGIDFKAAGVYIYDTAHKTSNMTYTT